MTWHQRVIWSEGLFLQPHHLQQQDRFIEHQLRSHARASEAWMWGTLSLSLDPLALELGKIALVAAEGHLPDGTHFSFPDDAPAPAPLDIPPDTRGETVLLGVPMARPGAKEFDIGQRLADAPDITFGAIDGNGYANGQRHGQMHGQMHGLRYCMSEAEVTDNVAGSNQVAQMQTAAPNLRLMLERDATAAYATIGVARVLERGAEGRVTLDPAFIAPSLDVGRQAALAGWLRELCALLRAQGNLLAQRFTEARSGGVAEIVDVMLLMLVNRHEARAEHLQEMPVLHPEQLFEAMRELAGELATFESQRRPAKRVAYRHDSLADCFGMLMNMIRGASAWRIQRAAQPIEIVETAPGQRQATLHDPELLKRARIVFAARAQMSSEALRVRFAAQAKVAPAQRIQEIVTLALPGITLRALSTVPPQIPVHAGFDYFELEPGGDLWRQLQESGQLAMRVLGDFPALEVECWAVRL
ncbi:type VI secretion system baseplate subunit TssK [Caballeronia sp. 15715]|uniref:type VI secretion system baseplate subunit TssK n=1 Tax=Caballeronia sp. 15715 TaxID=3391030 RepID=UPI0039E513EA